jgi:hypothetical protein
MKLLCIAGSLGLWGVPASVVRVVAGRIGSRADSGSAEVMIQAPAEIVGSAEARAPGVN